MIQVWGLAPLLAMKVLTCITCTVGGIPPNTILTEWRTVFDWGTDTDTILTACVALYDLSPAFTLNCSFYEIKKNDK